MSHLIITKFINLNMYSKLFEQKRETNDIEDFHTNKASA